MNVVSAPPEAVAPAHLWLPEHVSTAGAEAKDFARSLGFTLDPEQELCLDAIFAERSDGQWAAFEVAIICARQNLKTFVFELAALAKLFLFGSELVVWTAHEFKTAMEAFRWLRQVIEGSDWLSRRVRKVSEGNGDEAIELHTGQRLIFKARTRSGGRGLTGDDVVLDEAFRLTPSEIGSLLPTLSARPNPQVLYGSSAGKAEAEVLRAVRDRGRAGGDARLAYVEWCAPGPGGCEHQRCDHRIGIEGCALDDPENWRRANPAMDRRISAEHIATERRAMPPAEFARERLGWWEEPDKVGAAVPLDAWAQCRDRSSSIGTVRAFALDVAPDLSWSAIAVCGPRADGMAHVEVVEYRPGTDWVAERAAGLIADHSPTLVIDGEPYGLVVDSKGPVRSLLDELADAGVVPYQLSTTDVAQGCGLLVDRLNRRSLRHLGQPELDTAVRSAVRRQVNDVWLFSRRLSPVEISPLVAVTEALWAACRFEAEEAGTPFFAAWA